jgi:hypothetical protein
LVRSTWQIARHPVLAALSNCCPGLWGRLPTCYSPVRRCTHTRRCFLARLACVKHAASVRPEPGSNSPKRTWCSWPKPRDKPRRELELSRNSGAANRSGVTRSSPRARRPSVQQRSRTGFVIGPAAPKGAPGSLASTDRRTPQWRRLDRLPARCSVFKDRVPVGTL